MNKSILGSLIVLVAVIASGVAIFNSRDSADNSRESQSNTSQSSSEEFNLKEVQSHAAETDCWTIIAGNVYDLTEYIPRHPGGDEVLRACGADGTSLFEQRKTDSGEKVGSGSPHSSGAENQLESYLLGELAN